MRKTSIAISMALASIGTVSLASESTIYTLRTQSYPVSNRHTGKAAERRNAKRRRRAKK